MNQIMAMLNRRILGIPAWGWALVIGGTIVGYAYLTRTSSDDSKPTVAPTASAYPGDYWGDDDDDLSDDDDDDDDSYTEPDITTNPAWLRYVTDRLVSEGTHGAVEVTTALNKVLNGLAVNAQEEAIFNVAVRRFGAPPEGNPPVEKVTPTTPTNPAVPTPPRGYGWYKVKRGDSVDSIAKNSNTYKENLFKFNGARMNRLTVGEYLKTRSNSNPVNHPYFG